MPSATHRAVLRQPISKRRELALQFAVLVGMGVLGGLVLLGGAYLHRDDERAGQREVGLQVRRDLQPGEQVLARTAVTRRHWWDHFRATPGQIVATDRRLLYVGAVPPALFRANDDPPSFEEWSYAYDTTLAAHPGRTADGSRGVVVRTPDEVARFAVPAAQRDAAASVIRMVEERRGARLADIQRQQAVFDSIVALPPPPPLVHIVRPGETLYGIAAQYNVTPEVLQAMNGMTSDRIRIRDELIIRRYRRINGTVVEYYGPGQE